MTDKVKVLYIDDEPNNLVSFKASFRLAYDVITALSAIEAMQKLNENPDTICIISDQRMPDKSGVEFFEEIRYSHPKPVRILLTGFTDIEDVINAVNKGHIFRYIRKPWLDSDITSAIEEAHKYYLATSMLEIQNENLRKAYRELDRFAYSVTHDLKGPIISTRELLKLLKNEPEYISKDEVIGLMIDSMDKLDSFVENIFDYYRVNQGELTIKKVDFNQILEDQLSIHKMAIKLKNIDFSIEINQKSAFHSDEVKLRIIIYNLITNAIKYQKKDGIEKKVNFSINVNDGFATINISDTGIGIPEIYQDKIFDIFYRATSQEPGSGIGLYNVKDAVHKLNGNIELYSKEDEGTTFIVTIPGKL
jgi:signal transduction histidine kinase